MSKREPSEYNLYVKHHMAVLIKDYAESGHPFKASTAMKDIARMWRREHGVDSPAPKKDRSPKAKKARSPKAKSVGCDETWVAKCSALDKVCRVGPTGRRGCGQSPDVKKAKAAAAAKAYRASKKAGMPLSMRLTDADHLSRKLKLRGGPF